MAETSYMARFGARRVTNGYGILPIGPGTKKPGQFKRGAWADYPEWNRHAERPTTEVEVTTWSAWPECGIGLVGGAVAAVDIDADKLAGQIHALDETVGFREFGADCENHVEAVEKTQYFRAHRRGRQG